MSIFSFARIGKTSTQPREGAALTGGIFWWPLTLFWSGCIVQLLLRQFGHVMFVQIWCRDQLIMALTWESVIANHTHLGVLTLHDARWKFCGVWRLCGEVQENNGKSNQVLILTLNGSVLCILQLLLEKQARMTWTVTTTWSLSVSVFSSIVRSKGIHRDLLPGCTVVFPSGTLQAMTGWHSIREQNDNVMQLPEKYDEKGNDTWGWLGCKEYWSPDPGRTLAGGPPPPYGQKVSLPAEVFEVFTQGGCIPVTCADRTCQSTSRNLNIFAPHSQVSLLWRHWTHLMQGNLRNKTRHRAHIRNHEPRVPPPPTPMRTRLSEAQDVTNHSAGLYNPSLLLLDTFSDETRTLPPHRERGSKHFLHFTKPATVAPTALGVATALEFSSANQSWHDTANANALSVAKPQHVKKKCLTKHAKKGVLLTKNHFILFR